MLLTFNYFWGFYVLIIYISNVNGPFSKKKKKKLSTERRIFWLTKKVIFGWSEKAEKITNIFFHLLRCRGFRILNRVKLNLVQNAKGCPTRHEIARLNASKSRKWRFLVKCCRKLKQKLHSMIDSLLMLICQIKKTVIPRWSVNLGNSQKQTSLRFQ